MLQRLGSSLVKHTGKHLSFTLDKILTALNPNNSKIDYLNTIVNVNQSPRDNSIAIQEKESNSVRFVTWNLWTEYSTKTWFGDDRQSPDKTMQLQKQFLDVRGDYFGFQEAYMNPAITWGYLTVNPLKYQFFGMTDDAKLGDYIGNMTLTKFKPTESKAVIYSDTQPTSLDVWKRGYIREKLPNGIVVYNTHLSTDPARTTTMLAELLAEIKENGGDKVVLLGDFNVRDASALSEFEDYGFTIVNKSVWGGEIDRILVRGLNITGYGMVEILGGKGSHLSDHNMFYVDVEV
ncbi:hypothetical protein [Proteus phage PM 116]|uniref:Endonuclease/exonuclease/phosphatase domain-containing protein n=1 Tax=Proteus phage PM 116 TaxID=1837877 RepID=A0A2D0VK29_9CAUD|nr:hypothetical protein HOS11_gp49 [Proteus phage PM 116]ANU80131.1 hypothetical protein [Proteus phage PM 116]